MIFLGCVLMALKLAVTTTSRHYY